MQRPSFVATPVSTSCSSTRVLPIRFFDELRPDLLRDACEASGQPLTLREHEGYDHGYFFVSTFIEDHLRFHAEALQQS